MSDKKMVQKVIHSTNAQTLTHAAQGIERISVRPCIDSLPRQLFFSHVCNTIMVVCAVHKASERGILRFARLNERRSYWRTAIQTRMRFITTHTRALGSVTHQRRLDHAGRGTQLCMEKHRVSCICYLSKTHFVRDFLQNSIGNSSTSTTCNAIYIAGSILYSCKSQWNSIDNSSGSTTCNPIYIAGTILQLQITMEFCRPHMHEKHLTPHLQCGTDPNMIRAWSEDDPNISDHTRDRLATVAPQR